VRFLLGRVGYKGDELNKMVKTATTKIDSISNSTTKLAMLTRANKLRQEAIKLDTDKKSDKDKATNKAAIRDFFQKSPNAADVEHRGLGMTLKGEPKN